MTANAEKVTFLQSLQALVPFLSANAKKELEALAELLAMFKTTSLAELKNALVKQRKNFLKTPDGFIARIEKFQNGETPDFGDPDTVETLVADFRKATASTVKAVAKKFDLALTDKKDADAFEHWLKTGVKPPTAEELLKGEIEPEIKRALELRDQTRRELAPETIRQILEVAERVKKTFKAPGLAIFMRGVDAIPTAKTVAALMKELRDFLEDYALNRYKATQIREELSY